MSLIIIPLFIIAVLVGFYYKGDIWKGIRPQTPSLQESESQIRDFLNPNPRENSPLDQLREE
ncbi:MAG: hypothetical protein AAB524_00085 [Patescibacteria group bacterium]